MLWDVYLAGESCVLDSNELCQGGLSLFFRFAEQGVYLLPKQEQPLGVVLSQVVPVNQVLGDGEIFLYAAFVHC